MSFYRSLIRSSIALFGSCGAGYCYWVHKNSCHMPEEQRGNLLLRMGDVAKAVFVARKMEDTYTAKSHIKTILTLSSKASTQKRAAELSEQEAQQLKHAHFKASIQRILQNEPSLNPLVFNMSSPKWLESFAGPSDNLHDVYSLYQIRNGNYVICRVKVIQNIYINIIVAGTKDCKESEELAKSIVKCNFVRSHGAIFHGHYSEK